MKIGFSILEPPAAAPAIPPLSRAAIGQVEERAIRFLSTPKILAPIDPSGDPKALVTHAINVARGIGGELTLLHVRDPRSRASEWPPHGFASTLPGKVSRFAVTGSVPGTIAGFAEFLRADFVLLVTKRSRAWDRFARRSLLADVMTATDRPVLAMQTGSPFRCRRILCALSLDGADNAAVLQAEALARKSGGELILTSAVPVASEAFLYRGIRGADGPLSAALAGERIREIGENLSVPYKTSVTTGSPYRSIQLAAQRYAADIVVASRPTLDMRAVFRRLSCPLLSVAGQSGVRAMTSTMNLPH